MSAPMLDGKVAVVTGAGGTMGRAAAHGLIEDGCRVALIDLHEASMTRLVDEYADAVCAIACDISERDAVNDAHARVVGALGAVDGLNLSR